MISFTTNDWMNNYYTNLVLNKYILEHKFKKKSTQILSYFPFTYLVTYLINDDIKVHILVVNMALYFNDIINKHESTEL